MKSVSLLLIILFCLNCNEKPIHATLQQHLSTDKWIDLSYDFSDTTLYWLYSSAGFKLDTKFNGTAPAVIYYLSNVFFTSKHGDRHLDAPVHFAKGKCSSDEIPLQNLLGEAVMIDVSATVGSNADYFISVEDVIAWDKTNGNIPTAAIIFLKQAGVNITLMMKIFRC